MNQDFPILIVPGIGNSDPLHWQSRWQASDRRYQRVMQSEWDAPRCNDWIVGLEQHVKQLEGPVVLVAHSAGCALVLRWWWCTSLDNQRKILGALLVAPADPDGENFPKAATGFSPMPLDLLPFPSTVVCSDNDPYISARRAGEYAQAWGSRFVLLKQLGHINAESNLGMWDEGRELLNGLCTRY